MKRTIHKQPKIKNWARVFNITLIMRSASLVLLLCKFIFFSLIRLKIKMVMVMINRNVFSCTGEKSSDELTEITLTITLYNNIIMVFLLSSTYCNNDKHRNIKNRELLSGHTYSAAA